MKMKRVVGCQCNFLHIVLIIALASNLLTLAYLGYLQQRISTTIPGLGLGPGIDNNSPPHSHTKKSHKSIFTVLLRDFEDFDNGIAQTVNSMLEYFPGTDVVVIADDVPYPPLHLPQSKHVKLVALNSDLNKSLVETQPHNFIKSQYVLILPDATEGTATAGVVLGKNITGYMINVLEQQSELAKLVAWPLNGINEITCLKLNVSFKEWTLVYNTQSMGYKYCDALGGRFAVFMRTQDLLNLPAPFTRPMHSGLFVQTALRRWRVHIDKKGLFRVSRSLFSNPHSNWKHKSLEFSRMKQMYADFGIKLVKRDQEPEQWYGCSRETSRCFGTIVNDMPEYLYRGRWTPPCCLKALRATAKHVFQELESHGVRYWLEGGSLLGAMRHADIIPWDYDIDIGIYKEDIPKSPLLSQCQEGGAVEEEEGFVWELASEGNFFRVQYSQSNHLHVDIFPFYSRQGIMTKDSWIKSHKQDTEFPEHFLQPLTKLQFAGLLASAPNNCKDFLELKFGEGVIDNPRLPDGGHAAKP